MPTDSAQESALLTVADVAKILCVSEVTVRRLQEARKIRFIKVGRCVRFSSDDVTSFVAQSRVETIGK
jgi:excisionase family DNA binding protein